MRVAFHTLGCKVNQFESQAIAEQFLQKGALIVPLDSSPDIVVVNTCAVTAKAAYQSRQMLRRLKRTNSDCKVIATGCYVQIGASEIMEAVPGGVCMVGNDQKERLVDLSVTTTECCEIYVGDISRKNDIAPFIIRRPHGRTRAFVKIQDGCNSFCSYCIVPYSRGRPRSLPLDKVLEQVSILAREGVKEIVLTGIHIGLYGIDLKDRITLLDLLKTLCNGHPELRFRLSSIEPTEISPEMIEWAKNSSNFCPHWHVPLQSGSDKILSLMNRHYTSAYFRELVETLKRAMPNAAIGTDVMTGFPSEDEADFRETVSLLSALPITYVHAFPFSKRSGTLAAAMADTVTKKEKAKRVQELNKISLTKKSTFYQANIGRIMPCLLEQKDKKTGLWKGLTPNYIPVLIEKTPESTEMANQVVKVMISHTDGLSVYGKMMES